MQFQRGNIGAFFRGDKFLKGWWALEKNAIDLSGYAHHGTVNGALSVPGIITPSSYYFNGSSYYIEVSGHSDFQPTTNISFGGWIKTGITNNNPYIFLCYGGKTGGNLSAYEISVYNQKINAFVRFTGGGKAVNSVSYVNDNKPHFVVVTVSGNLISLYIDGKLEATDNTGTGNISYGAGTQYFELGVGANGQALQYYYNGYLDEAFFFSRVLSAQEISQYYQWATLPFKRYIFPWENKLKETVSLQSLLEKTLKETTSLHSLLETFKKDSVALTSQLEEQLKSTTALWTELEMILSGADTVALYSLLEKLTYATVSLQTTLEKCKGETVALSTFLQYEKVSPIAIQSDLNYLQTQTLALQAELEWASRNTIALRTLFEKTMQSTTSLVSDLRPFKVKHELDNYDKHTSKIHNIKKL